jgi:tetratricopeptide (TPR) repeat protein
MGGGYTHSVPAPSPGRLFLCAAFLCALVFVRPPTTNFIFDEQEALLGNPYLTESSSYLDAFRVDFWGRAPGRTIGSYRPLPNLLWWPLRGTFAWNTPWAFCLLNLLVHAGTGTLFTLALQKCGRRRGVSGGPSRLLIWGAGAWVLVNASATEAVCSAVGLADLLVGFFTVSQLFLLLHLAERRGVAPCALFLVLLFVTTFLGLLSKETMLGSILWLPFLSILWAPIEWSRARVLVGALLATGASVFGLVGFVFLRARLFPAAPAKVPSLVGGGFGQEIFAPFFAWYRQPVLPVEVVNNPLFGASASERWATGLRLFFEQAAQVFFPWELSADHSFPRTTVTSWGFSSYCGAALLFLLVGLLGAALFRRLGRKRQSGSFAFYGAGAALVLCTYLPVSNLFVLLPTVRGDRLLYGPTLGAALVLVSGGRKLSAGLSHLTLGFQRERFWSVARKACSVLFLLYLGFQAALARLHALDYRNDVTFWRATSQGEPASAKAHLNLGVMLGARGDEKTRLRHTLRAVSLAPDWPMARIYLGDVYCRLSDIESAFPHYQRGFREAPNAKTLTALGLQCLWEQGGFSRHRSALLDLAVEHPGTWLDYFVTELAVNGEQNDGIAEKYRPRKYNSRAALK